MPDSAPVTVLRLGHRPSRDKRISTHLLLAARAFGASSAVYTGVKDPGLEESVSEVARDWGGVFPVEYSRGYRDVIRGWKGKVVHLTMYGLPVQDVIAEIRADPEPKLVVVGGAKVPGEVYGLADWNVSVTLQPHSEVSALAVFLDRLTEGKMLSHVFPGARFRIEPTARGKHVERVC